MSSENISLTALLKRQESEKKDLAAGVYEAWLVVRQKAIKFTSGYSKNQQLPHSIKRELQQLQKNFFAEWGSDGKLATLMQSRHEKERENLIKRQTLQPKFEKKDEWGLER